MMRTSTLVVVAAVVLLGLLAALDALRGTTTATSQPTLTGERPVEVETISLEPEIEDRAEVQRRLRASGITGTLFLTDEDCRLRALSLPALRWVLDSKAQGEQCEFTVAPDSRRVVRFGGGISWSPDGRTSALCDSNRVVLFGRTGQEVGRARGHCAPAWRPDGTLTAARLGTLVAFRRPCAEGLTGCEEELLAPEDLAPALEAGSTPLRVLHAPLITQAIWLSGTRVALIIRALDRDQPESTYDLLAIYEGRDLIGEPVGNSEFDELVASPSRRYLAVHGSSFRGLTFIDSDGRLLARNPIASGHHAAWSPDERWTAVATGGSMYVFRSAETEFFSSDSRPRAIRIPVHAADVEWR
jgi:hypothetical protein